MESAIYLFTEKMGALLEMERQAELEESAGLLQKYSLKVWATNWFVKELEKRDLAITKLAIKEVSTGIYGKILVTFERIVHPGQ